MGAYVFGFVLGSWDHGVECFHQGLQFTFSFEIP